MKSKLIYVSLLMLLPLAMVACSETKDKELNYETDGKTLFEAVDIPDNLSIDLELDKIESVKSANNYKAKHIAFDKEKLVDVLIEGEVVKELLWAEGPQVLGEAKGVEEILNLQDGGSAFFNEIKIPPIDFRYGKYVAGINSDNLGTVVLDDFGSQAYMFEFQNNSDYESYVDLDFLPYEEALSNIFHLFGEIDMPTLTVDETYSVDLETMEEHYKVYQESYGRVDIDWTKDDEFYLFSMQQLVDDLPLINKDWKIPDRAKASPLGAPRHPYTTISVMYDKYGIRRIDTSNILDIVEDMGRNDLIPLNEALEKLIEGYAQTTFEEVSIVGAQLSYLIIAEQGGDGYDLIPGWVFVSEVTSSEDSINGGDISYRHDVIDAVTGQPY